MEPFLPWPGSKTSCAAAEIALMRDKAAAEIEIKRSSAQVAM